MIPVCVPLFFCTGFGFALVLDGWFLFVCVGALAVNVQVPMNVISASTLFFADQQESCG